MTTTSRTEFVDPTMPSTPIVVRAVERRVTECPTCRRPIGSMPASEIVCPRKAES
jgi:hypothetical protein